MTRLDETNLGDDGPTYADAMRASLFACSDNRLITTFFSRRNIQNIQTNIRIIMREKYGHNIGPQDETELVLVMRGIYTMHANTVCRNVDSQIRQLNAEVLAYVIPNIKTNIDHYLGFLRDSTRPYVLLERPQNTSLKGEQTLQLYSPI